ncbi:MAG: LolA family protein [Fusobacteriaceae bacterium]
MKKIISAIFMVFYFVISAKENPLHTLNNISFQVKESTTLDGGKRELTYEILMEFPDKMKKTLISPEINRGEIYLYSHGEKTVYLPFFNQIEKSEISPEENRVLEFIKTLMELEKNNRDFKENYYKNLNQKIKMNSGEVIEIKSRKESDGYFLPNEIEVFSEDIKISALKLSNFKSNIPIREDEFKIKNENSK